MTSQRRIALAMLGVLALALVLRFHGLGWGLPAVYEEAYPFKKSWEMWGWGPGKFSLNPHFFNYPTFYFYVQFLGQGLLFVLLKITGTVHSTLDYRVLYALDKTSFYLLARGISAVFGIATVYITYLLGRRVSGTGAGLAAAFLVAVNQSHIVKSQAVEVDVPMTALATLCLLFAVWLMERPARRNYLLAAVCGGLATATKYNGVLLALPIAAAHWCARESLPGAGKKPATLRRPPWKRLLLAAAVFAGTVVLASPYIVLDRANFWVGFTYERQHMKIGHFGLDDTPAFLWYLKVFTDSLLGWPMALLALAGAAWFAWRRQAWALVLGIFPIVYIAVLSSWSMKAERYMLVVLPVAAVFAAAFSAGQAERLRGRFARGPALALAIAALVMATPSGLEYLRNLDRLRGDTRTAARQWIEQNAPAGSFLLLEPYGPEPLGAIELKNEPPDVRQRIQKERPDARIYAIQTMPMYQVRSENSAIFYSLALYQNMADYIVTSSSITSRYRKVPAQYPAQNAFYDSLSATWTRAKEFGIESGGGPRITIWQNPRRLTPFAARTALPVPPMPAVVRDLLPGSFSAYFERYGFLLESYQFYEAAVGTFLGGLRYTDQPREAQRPLVVGAIRAAIGGGNGNQALAILDEAERLQLGAPAAYWQNLRQQLLAPARPKDSNPPAPAADSQPPAP